MIFLLACLLGLALGVALVAGGNWKRNDGSTDWWAD